jgi:ABC-type polysaccharide/polyol phosphate transport system ATPase subunit
MSKTAREQVLQHHIRKSLAFAEMADRSNVIGRAHRDTFGWFFKNEKSSEMTPEMTDARISYAEWISSGAGIFHIEGKPGSGKSTLMKFLTSHSNTTAGLTRWAGKLA